MSKPKETALHSDNLQDSKTIPFHTVFVQGVHQSKVFVMSLGFTCGVTVHLFAAASWPLFLYFCVGFAVLQESMTEAGLSQLANLLVSKGASLPFLLLGS